MTSTKKSAVANLLVEKAKTWVDTSDIVSVGGAGGTRRLRELRNEEGWNIKTKREGKKYSYKLSRVPAKKVLAQYV